MGNNRGGGTTEGRGGFSGLFNFFLTLVVSLGTVGACVGGPVAEIFDWQPIMQGQLAARHGKALACTYFTPGRCVQHCGFVRGTGPAFKQALCFLPPPPPDGFADGIWPSSDLRPFW